jgi:hypothetical protein
VPLSANAAPGRKTTGRDSKAPQPDALDPDTRRDGEDVLDDDGEVDIRDVLARRGRLSMTDGRPRVAVEVRCMKLEHDDHVRKPD